jgi:hypothetical protein
MKNLLILLSLFVSFSAFAADPGQGPADAAIAKSAHPTELANPSDAVKDKTLLAKPIGDACKSDRVKFCKHVHGAKNKMSCLKAHTSELSKACQDSLTATMPAKK